MHSSSFSYPLTATLALSSTVLAAPSKPRRSSTKFIRLPVSQSRVTMPEDFARRDLNVPITNEISIYSIELDVGSPKPQQNKLFLDTGSSDIWMYSPAACAQSACFGGSFDVNGSSSAVSRSDLGNFAITYFDHSTATGSLYSDTIAIAGSSINNVTFAVVDTKSSIAAGVMGVGLPGLSSIQTQPSVINDMVTQGLISSHSYSLYLDNIDASTGAVLFGGHDPSKHHGDLVNLTIVEGDGPQGQNRLAVTLTGMSVHNRSSPTGPSTFDVNFPVVLDSGFTDSVLPDDLFAEIAKLFEAQHFSYNGIEGWAIPCKQPANSTVDFAFAGVSISVPFNELALPGNLTPEGERQKYQNEYCRFGFRNSSSSGGQGVITFGDTFLRSAYVLYDFDAMTIGLAQASHDSSCADCAVGV